MSSDLRESYERFDDDGRIRHIWAVKSDEGAVHIWAEISPAFSTYPARWMGGCECHSPKPPEYRADAKPDHEHCEFLDGPCWHDGTSLYFSENIAGSLPGPWLDDPHQLQQIHHDKVMMEARHLYRQWLQGDER